MGDRMRRRGKRPRRQTRTRWLLVAVMTLLGGVAGYLATGQLEPVYQATTTLMVGDLTTSADIKASDMDTSLSLSNAYATLMRSETVLGPVVRDLGLSTSWNELRNRVHVSPNVGGVPTIRVTVFDTTPRSALTIVRAVATQTVDLSPSAAGVESESVAFAAIQADELKAAIQRAQSDLNELEAELTSTTTAGGRAAAQSRIVEQTNLIADLQTNYLAFAQTVAAHRPSNHVEVLEPAFVAQTPLRPHRTVNAGLGAGIGMLLGLAIAVRPRRAHPDVADAASRDTANGKVREGSQGAPDLPPRPGEDEVDPWLRELAERDD